MKVSLILAIVLTAFVFVRAQEDSVNAVHYELGLKYAADGKNNEAIEEFRKMLTLDPGHSGSYYQMGLCWRDLKKYPLSIYNFKKAAKYEPQNNTVLRDLSDAYYKNGEPEKALATLRECINQEPDSVKKAADEQLIRKMLMATKGIKEAPAIPATAKPAADTAKKSAAVAPAPAPVPAAKPAPAPKNVAVATGVDYKNPLDEKKVESSTDPLLTVFLEHYNRGDYKKALLEAKNVIKKQPGHPGIFYYGGLIRRDMKDPKAALVNFQKGLAYPEKGINSHYYMGRIFQDQKKYPEAVAAYEKFIRLTGDPAAKTAVQKRLSDLLKGIKKGTLDPAMAESAEKALGKPPAEEKPSPFQFKVSDDFTFLIEDTLRDKTGSKMLHALDLFLDERYDESLNDLKTVYRESPQSVNADNALYNIGLVYAKMRLFDNAEIYLAKALAEYPKSDVADASALLRGYVFSEKGAYDNAVGVYENYLKAHPETKHLAYIHASLGDIAYRRNDVKNALRHYLIALGKTTGKKEKVVLEYKIGECYWRDGSPRGIDYYKQAAEADSSFNLDAAMEACFRLGDYYYKIKNLESAQKYYKMAVSRFPKSGATTWAQYQIGNIYKQGGRYDDALKAYQKLMNAHPDDYWAQQAQWKREDVIWENEYKEVLK